ncbi:TonB-dependent receptor [Pontiellaceae bacterium B1224]|nr:TonB-dependent receptor [Pontiellaceae bacterium B1224]
MRIQWWTAGCLMGVLSAFAGSNSAIIVSAPRLDNLDLMQVDIAADVTVIDRAAIESSGAVSVPELLESEANVLVRGQGGNASDGQLSMRGFGENSQVRVLVLVDGHKVNRPDMGAIAWQSLPVGSIDKIEVIRGGQNVLYGNHALSGVVKITTTRGGDSGLQLEGAIGSFGYLNGSLNYGDALGDVDFSLGISGTDYDGYRMNSSSSALSFNTSAGWFLNDTDVLTFRLSGSDSSDQFPGAISYDQMQEDPTQSSNPGDQLSDSTAGLATLLYETEREWGAARFLSGINMRGLESSISGQYAQNDQLGFSFAPRVRYGSESRFFMAGFDFFYDQLDVDNYYDEARTIVESWAELNRITAAPYLFAQHAFSDKTILNGGARFEYAGTDNLYTEYEASQLPPFIGSFPNPDYKQPPDIDPDASFDGLVEKYGWAAELSIARQLSEPLNVFAGYDRVYRYPTLDEAAAYQGYPLSDPLNENLDPEQGNNFEIGAKYSHKNWNASLTAFYLMLENEITYDDVQKLNYNLGETQRLGLETMLQWDRGWYGAGTVWNFVQAEFADGAYKGNTVPLVPWAHGNFKVWVAPVELLRLGMVWSYVSEQYQGNDFDNVWRKMDAYGLLGFQADMMINKNVQIIVSMQNLLDETYATSAYSGGFYPGSGRSFRVGMRVKF